MEGIKDTVLSVIGGLEKKRQGISGDTPEEILKKVLTKKELGHIKVNYFNKGLVYINVDSSSWLYQLGLRKDAILTQIKKESKTVKDIRFRIGEIS